jgi:hypothetical protein
MLFSRDGQDAAESKMIDLVLVVPLIDRTQISRHGYRILILLDRRRAPDR